MDCRQSRQCRQKYSNVFIFEKKNIKNIYIYFLYKRSWAKKMDICLHIYKIVSSLYLYPL